MKKFIFKALLLTMLLLPAFGGVSAQDPDTFELNVGIKNPLGDGKTEIKDIVGSIMKVIVDIALPIVIVMVIYSGFLYVIARGNPDKIKVAHQTLTWTLVGAVVLLGAQLISTVLIETVSNISKDAGLKK